MEKKTYLKPAMRVVELRHQCQLLIESLRGVPEGIKWQKDGISIDDDDV